MADHVCMCWRELSQVRWAGTKPRRPTTDSSFNTPISTVCCAVDHFLSCNLGLEKNYWRSDWRSRLCKTQLLITVAEWCCLLIKIYSHQPLWKIHIITDWTHLQQQRRKTSQQSAFFPQEWHAVTRWLCVKTELHHFAISQSWNHSPWNLLPWLASAATAAACHTLSLWWVQKQCLSVQVMLVFWHSYFTS